MKILAAAVLAALTFAMAAGHGFLTRPILADDQLYFYMTERFASGVPPHVAHLEVKTQLPTIIGGTALKIGRAIGVDDVTAGRTANTAAAALCVILMWLIARELTRIEAAGAVAAMGAFVLYGLYLEAAVGFQPKIYMMMFMLGAHLACAWRRPLLCGFLAMCGFLCWQPAALVLAACGLATLLDRGSTWRSVFRLTGGAIAAFVLYELFFALQGALGPQIHQELLAFGSERKPINLKESFWFLLTEARGFERYPHVLPTIFFATTAIMLVASLVRPSRTVETIRSRPGLVAFWIAALLATAFTIADHQAHPDMLLVQPYFAIATGIAAGWLFSPMLRAPSGKIGVAVVIAAFAFYVQRQARIDVGHSMFSPMTGIAEQRREASYLELYFDHRGSVWVLGSVHLLGLLQRENWTPVGNFGRETADIDTKTWRPLRDGKMPEIIVAGRGLRPGFQSWLNQEYIDITPAVFARDRIRVFSRRLGTGSGFDKGSAPKSAPPPSSVRRPPPRPAAQGAATPARGTPATPRGATTSGGTTAAPGRPQTGTAGGTTGGTRASGRNAP